MIMATFGCAIEMEPKTLNPDQLNHAKELAAACIIQKTVPHETSDFIIQEARKGEISEEIEHVIEENTVKGLDNIVTIPYQCTINIDNVATESAHHCLHHCLCNAIVVESPISDEARHREPLTAPF